MGVLWVGGVEVAMRSQLLKDYDGYRRETGWKSVEMGRVGLRLKEWPIFITCHS